MRRKRKTLLVLILTLIITSNLGVSSFSAEKIKGSEDEGRTFYQEVPEDSEEIEVQEESLEEAKEEVDQDEEVEEDEEADQEEEVEEDEEADQEEDLQTLVTIYHWEKKGEEKDLLDMEIIEDLELGSIFKKADYVRDYEGLFYAGSQLEEIILEAENIVDIYYQAEEDGPGLLFTNLTVNHIEISNNEEYLMESELIEGLELGGLVFADTYVRSFHFLDYEPSQGSQIELLEEGNELNLYYRGRDSDYVPENPDFAYGQEEEIPSPHIEKFYPGELGPFPEEVPQTLEDEAKKIYYPDEENNKVWPEEGSLLLTKSGQALEGRGNQWEILVDIQARDKKENSDLVLVIDRSTSMKGERMERAREAARDFVEGLLEDPTRTSTRIGIVSFASDVRIEATFQGQEGKEDLISAIEGIAPGGGTHIQAGLRQAIELLAASRADHKHIVFLGDGAATYSYKIRDGNNYLEYWKTELGRDYYRTSQLIPIEEFEDWIIGNGGSEYEEYEKAGSIYYGTSYSKNYMHGAHAVAEADFARKEGYQLYSIGLGAAGEGEWTLENIADPGKYYSTDDPNHLETIFQEIAGRIYRAATEAQVEVPLGDMYSILGINENNYEDLIEVSQGKLSYDIEAKKILWRLEAIEEGEDYWMKYKLALDYGAEGGIFYPANEASYIDYKNIDGEEAKKYFTQAEFRLRELSLTQVARGLEDQEFNLIIEGPEGDYSRIWSLSLQAGQSKAIKGLPAGRYKVSQVLPMNHRLLAMRGGRLRQLAASSYQLLIGEEDWKIEVEVENERTNKAWFFDQAKVYMEGPRTVMERLIGSPLGIIRTWKTGKL